MPLPRATIAGPTFVDHDGHLWELTPWLPGEPSYARGSEPQTKLVHAMQALAHFHCAAESFPRSSPVLVPSPGIRIRLERLRWWASTGLDQLRAAISSFPIPRSPSPIAAFPVAAMRLCDQFVAARPIVEPCLTQALDWRVRLQPCIRDIWHDNVLFTGDQVSGLVDFGAMEFDNVAADVARLLASLASDDAQQLGTSDWPPTSRCENSRRPKRSSLLRSIRLTFCYRASTGVGGTVSKGGSSLTEPGCWHASMSICSG